MSGLYRLQQRKSKGSRGVSEETGRISIAVDHEIHYNLTLDEFRMKLVEELKPKAELFYDADGSENEGDEDE